MMGAIILPTFVTKIANLIGKLTHTTNKYMLRTSLASVKLEFNEFQKRHSYEYQSKGEGIKKKMDDTCFE